MALFSKDIETLDDLFVHQLRDIYYAEKQIVKALPKMIDKATNATLKAAFATISTKPGITSTRARAGLRDACRQGQGRRLPRHRWHPRRGERG